MDAKRCRDKVNRCIELAKDAKDAETRSILFGGRVAGGRRKIGQNTK
jgi:hypothetical protein